MKGRAALSMELSSGLDEIVRHYRPMVFQWALALVGDPDEADDVVQETFVRVAEKLGSYRGDGVFEGWLYRITRRVAGSRRRTASRRARLAASPTAQPSQEVYLTDPGARVDRQRAAAAIIDLSRRLPSRQREVFTMCDLHGKSPMEVSSVLGMNTNTVRAHLFKARATIRQRLLMQYGLAVEGVHHAL